jgi:hypothetical protein
MTHMQKLWTLLLSFWSPSPKRAKEDHQNKHPNQSILLSLFEEKCLESIFESVSKLHNRRTGFSLEARIFGTRITWLKRQDSLQFRT